MTLDYYTVDGVMTHTIPHRTPEPTWEQGDIVYVDGTRWLIHLITKDRRAVHLTRMSDTACVWKTTLSRLPRKVS